MRRTPATPTDDWSERGVAMLEFVMMLPFVFIILVLLFNFGQGYLARQRMLVAVREMGLRHSEAVGVGGASMDAIARDLAGDTLQLRRLTAQFAQRDDGTCPGRADESPDGRFGRSAFREFASFMGRISSSHSYDVDVTLPRLAGRVLANRRFIACFAIDDNPWTIYETGQPLDKLTGLFGRLGRLAGSIF